MKNTWIILIVFCLFMNCKKDRELSKSKNIKFEKIAELDWLVGNWINDAGLEKSYENWIKKNDSTLTAHSFTLLGRDTIFAERITLTQKNNETLFIVNAYQETEDQVVVFKLQKNDNGIYSFENPRHDYPKSISYSNPVRDSLHAWIEGTVVDEYRKIDFLFKRVN